MNIWEYLTYTLFYLGDLKIAAINIIILVVLIILSRFLIKIVRSKVRKYLINKKLRLEEKKITLFKLLGQGGYFLAFMLSIESLRINNDSTNFDQILQFKLITIGNFSFGLSHIFEIIVILFVARLAVNLVKLFVQRSSLDEELEMDQGTQFVVVQLVKYAIYVFAFLIILDRFGVDPTLLVVSSSGLLIGIGFGLQDLFRDVVSGFILLFEGTTKVGDIIEIPNSSGMNKSNMDNMVAKVLKINIRTTKIETRDGNIMIIPNAILTREYINNWSYSSSLTRFMIKFSVEYGTDLDLVQKIVEEAVSSHPKVKKKVNVKVRLLNFGENGIEMDVIFWADQTWRIEFLKSDIRFEIDKRFRENGIVVPFPQRTISYLNKDSKSEDNLDELRKDIERRSS
ncbi:MAG: mechanosensitive ion channel [Crocinitomicaceae bacterium]|nr:mechanosensitive ion channel [Crocinitomicaceae bacterium]